MSARPRLAAFAPFRVRSFRYQWPADLATSWAFEMETIILGWYVLTETGSVLLLTLFASLQHVGTLVAPLFGVMGDRVGLRAVLCAMRTAYFALAATLMTLAYAGLLDPAVVLVLAAVTGVVRPSDVGMRSALASDTMPPALLMGAISIQRTTQDSARIAGALTGTALVATLGMGPAYTVVAAFYATSALLTLQTGGGRGARDRRGEPAAGSPWRDLREGLAYVRRAPLLLALMTLAFFLNMTAFPLMSSLMPYVAKDVYGADQATLGYLVAAGACGALLGSVALSRYRGTFPAGRMVIVFSCAWYAMLMLFAQTAAPATGVPALVLAGIAFALGQISMFTTLLRNSDERFRGRIMGIRMLAIYGNLPGLWTAGVLIPAYGYAFTATLYCTLGIVVTVAIALRWRAEFWRPDAPANRR
ncbi:MAG: MFS transporter [Burkholderiales bacterium]|nr:MFS transporter [Burkholderiales bacterium]